ncbi:MAG: DUF1330 domain-containing protein [Pseudomonadales bacterium]
MIQILVELTVKNFDLLERYENQALVIMAKYGGRLLSSFETSRAADGTGEEIHLLQFQNEHEFTSYREDSDLIELADLREHAIQATDIRISTRLKEYVVPAQHT